MAETEAEFRTSFIFQFISLFRGKNYQLLKRGIDLILIFVLLLMFGPLMLLIALGIRLHSPGPILYRQKRIGLNGIPFDMLKFRSMSDGSDIQHNHKDHVQRLIRDNLKPEDLGSDSLKLNSDPRINGLGKILRKLSLDELPQFINVLRGDMSLVGPRPPLPYEYELYEDWHKARMTAFPGVTGLWQVTARNRVSFDEMVKIDLTYIENMSPWLDINIMLRTPYEMLRGKGGG